jgi:hypothetical protein
MADKMSKLDLSKFNDLLATKTEWTPVKSGGFNFRAQKLIAINANRVEIRVTKGYRFFSLFFIALGAAFIIYKFGEGFSLDLIFSLIFIVAGILMLYFGATPIIFDKSKGCFWKDCKEPDEMSGQDKTQNFAHLEDINAIQIISEWCKGDGRMPGYYSYELNLVLKDARRINVMDHGNVKKLRKEARVLSEFLGKPIWDSVDLQDS